MKPSRFSTLLLAMVAMPALLAMSAMPASAARAGTPAETPSAEASAPKTFVGSDVCVSCHGDIGENLTKTPHGKAGFAHLSSQGCETCHGPGSLHVADPSIEANRPRVDKLSTAAQNQLCTTCHSGGAQLFWHGGRHEARGLSCLSCHSVHAFKSAKAQLKNASVAEQCFTCHKDTRAETWKTSHHPIREGKIICVDCHNPHGTQTAKMIRAASVNEQCYTCHTEKRGPFLWEHAPVRESCLNCHTPHGSNHLKLQKTSVPYLCQQCHSNTRHPGTLYDGSSLADQAKASNRIFNRSCTDCHAAVHGSNNPSTPYLAH